MLTDEKERELAGQVAGLSTRMTAVEEVLGRNAQATSALREDVARLRGEVNGHLPRIERSVERVRERLDEGRDAVGAVREKAEVPACAACRDAAGRHQNEIGSLFGALGSKADARSNEEAHSRLWLFLQISLFAIAAGALGVLLAKAYGL